MRAIFVMTWIGEFLVHNAIAEVEIVLGAGTPTPQSRPVWYHSLNNTLIPSQSNLLLACIAKYPTEWIFDDDNESMNYVARTRLDWTERDIDEKLNRSRYDAKIALWYRKLAGEETFICRSVLNHNDSILVNVKPAQNGQLFNTSDSKSSKEYADSLQNIITREENGQRLPCFIIFEFAQLETSHFVRCSSAGVNKTIGNVDLHTCDSSLSCANSFRKLKEQASCLTVWTDRVTPIPNVSGWHNVDPYESLSAGSAVCTVESDGERRRSAVEFFFTAGHPVPTETRIHFSMTEVQPEDLIWMEPEVLDIYYVSETLETTCNFFDYGFSYFPMITITWMGVEIYKRIGTREDNNGPINALQVQFKFLEGQHEAGDCKLHCIAPVWNTTTWANKTKSFQLRESVHPYFERDFEIVNLTTVDGNGSLILDCDAVGDPIPFISWSWNKAIRKGIHSEGASLILSKGSNAFTNGTIISCTGTNRLNQSAIKRFQVVSTRDTIEDVRRDQSSSSNTIIIATAVATAFAVSIVIGFLCNKNIKQKRNIEANLTEREVKEFREGVKVKVENVITGDEQVVILSESMPYNTTFDVSKDRIAVDFNNELGSGEYGIVYKGSFKTEIKDASVLPIAVKTIKHNAPLSYLKALMSELKILAHVGSHDHIVNLICAWTSNIKKRELYVGIELCEQSLLKLLQESRDTFKNSLSKDTILLRGISLSEPDTTQDVENQNRTYSTIDLIKWAKQVASGMEYLTTRKVVHGDLAARNILISFDKQAKIGDFGLAKQLVNYTYLRLDQVRVPWAWMAPESLREMKFTSMSDTWSYGVVLWELFSLGKHPFSGYICNAGFLELLESGLRNPQPEFANEEIYKRVILECWRPNPKERPSFHQLMEYFGSYKIK